MIAFVGALVVGATGAWFTNSETSTGNTFTAGVIDLKVDNKSYITNHDGDFVASRETSWDPSDLLGKYFFKFADLKPGDVGEDTISLHVENNPAWACMDLTVTATPENNPQTTPESKVDTTVGDNEGELQNELNFVFWKDDGDNVLEKDEERSVFWQDSIQGISDSAVLALADSQGGVLENGAPLLPGETYFIGKAWCQGILGLDPLPQDNYSGPLDQGTGITCDGSQIGNASQTDGVVADVQFSVEQSRHNDGFLCNPPQEGTLTLVKEVVGGSMAAKDFDLYVDGNTGSPLHDGAVLTVSAESHSVTEGSYPDYALTYGADCTGGTVDVPANGNATCTVINTYTKGTLTVNKVVKNLHGGNEDASSFNLFIDDIARDFGVTYTVSAGAHVVEETASTADGVGVYIQTNSDACDQDGNVNVTADGSAVCTITNVDAQSYIKLINNVVGGSLGAQDFTMKINGLPVSSGTSKAVDSNYANSITEDPVTGYSITSITGDPKCPATLAGTATLDEGDSITCTITNTYTP